MIPNIASFPQVRESESKTRNPLLADRQVILVAFGVENFPVRIERMHVPQRDKRRKLEARK